MNGGVAGGWSCWTPPWLSWGCWEVISPNDMCHKCLAPAWLRGSVTVIGSGSCRWGSSSGSGTVIVGRAWKRKEKALRLALGHPA